MAMEDDIVVGKDKTESSWPGIGVGGSSGGVGDGGGSRMVGQRWLRLCRESLLTLIP